MLICQTCERVAEEDDWRVEIEHNTDMDGRPVSEDRYVYCPVCGSDEVVVAEKCEHCGEYIDPDLVILVDVPYKDDPEFVETLRVCPLCYDEYYVEDPSEEGSDMNVI